MPMNHADGTMIFSVVLYPLAAAMAAFHAGAGWLAILFMPPALVVGVAVAFAGRKFIYPIMGFALTGMDKMRRGWARQIIAAPAAVLYVILPVLIMWSGILATWFGSIWLVRHAF